MASQMKCPFDDPLSPEFLDDPYPSLTLARDECPVHYIDKYNVWLVTRYADVVEAMKQPDVKQRLEAASYELNPNTPEQFAAHINAEIEKLFGKLFEPPFRIAAGAHQILARVIYFVVRKFQFRLRCLEAILQGLLIVARGACQFRGQLRNLRLHLLLVALRFFKPRLNFLGFLAQWSGMRFRVPLRRGKRQI